MPTLFAHLSAWPLSFLATVFGPSSPLCPVYLLAAGLFAVLWLRREHQLSMGQALDFFRGSFRQSPYDLSCDLGCTLLQFTLLRAPVMALHVYLFNVVYRGVAGLGEALPEGWTVSWPIAWEATLVTLASILAIDAAAYAMHRALHAWGPLWQIHRFHHAARSLTPLTSLRQHPLEPFLMNGARGIGAGLVLGILHQFFIQSTPVVTVFGLGLGVFIYMFTVNLHHAPIPLRYPRWLGAWLLSPHLHHIHHSSDPAHYDVNFGVIFTCWDRLFGSYLDLAPAALSFGLPPTRPRRYLKFARLR